MGAFQSSTRELDNRKNGFSVEERENLDAPEVWPEVDALLEKIQRLSKTNEQLRALVTQLSVLVIKNIVDRDGRRPADSTIYLETADQLSRDEDARHV